MTDLNASRTALPTQMPHLALSKISFEIKMLDRLLQHSHTSVMQYLQRRLVILCISATSFFSLQAQDIPQEYAKCICMKLPRFVQVRHPHWQ